MPEESNRGSLPFFKVKVEARAAKGALRETKTAGTLRITATVKASTSSNDSKSS